jgi:ribonuclease HII
LNWPDYSLELNCRTPVCGVDEAGRGPWAGPVVAAAVILDPEDVPAGLNDSKKLSAARREMLFDDIAARAKVGVGISEVNEIDRLNIGGATYLAMSRAISGLPELAVYALIDGKFLPPGLPCPAQAVVKGDGRSLSIAAASIVAKVTRDRIMVTLSQQFPGYGWERNAGYGVKAHAEALKSLGVTPHHRRSFKPIHKILMEEIYPSR